jgi:adenylyl-sulfate kinase
VNAAGITIWLTGLPSSGKSTIARELFQRLRARGLPVELLDGEEVRESLSRDLGFSRADREENVRRIGYVAKLLSRNGVLVICAAVSPYRATRDEVRRNVRHFVEVYVECPVDVAAVRDTEGLWARAQHGEIEEFSGVNAPYEPPEAAEVHVRSDREAPEAAAARIIRALELLELIPAGPEGQRSAQEDDIRRRLAALGYL